jgi:hypothetical protein
MIGTKFTIQSGPIAGFAAEAGRPGEKLAIVTCASATSDRRIFHVWMKHIADAFLLQTSFPLELIHAFIVVVHSDNSADIYINDFKEHLEIQVRKAVKAGEGISIDNITDIRRVIFPEITIQKGDAVAYGRRNEWRFTLYFDFRRQLDLDELALSLGELRKEATFYSTLAAADARMGEHEDVDAFIFAEGKTDWKHLVAAGRALSIPFTLSFGDDGYGASDLLNMCEHCARVPHAKPIIFIFDRDHEVTMGRLRANEVEGRGYQDWGNNVFSLYLPIPPGRSDETHAICIEFFYPDADITLTHQSGRRLYLSTEFDPTTGADASKNNNCRDLKVLKGKAARIVAERVVNVHTGASLALSKDAFATAILNREPPFDKIDHSAFRDIFEIVHSILRR